MDTALRGIRIENSFPVYFLGKLLGIGPLSRLAFKDVMQDVLVDFTEADWQARKSNQIAELIQAAAFSIQNKCPQYSPVMCLWTVTQMYYAKWMRRHMPVKLVLSPDRSLLMVVRSGGFLSCVRRMIAVDQTIENTRAQNINWRNCPVDPAQLLLHASLRLRSICGDAFLDSSSLALLKGTEASCNHHCQFGIPHQSECAVKQTHRIFDWQEAKMPLICTLCLYRISSLKRANCYFHFGSTAGCDPSKDVVPAAVKTILNPVEAQGKPC